MEHTFDTLCDAITYAFRSEETSILSLDKICSVLSSSSLFINNKAQGLIPCQTITRRRISSTLSSSELFLRAGPPRTCLWAIRPNNPSFISDGAISASIEQMLTGNGPLSTEELVERTDLTGAHLPLFERFLGEHGKEFQRGEDEKWWFANQPRPLRRDFECLNHAILSAFEIFQEASVEELHWYLCLSTVGGKIITRRSISRELSRRQDLFVHLSRALYSVVNKHEFVMPTMPMIGFNQATTTTNASQERNVLPLPQISGITDQMKNFGSEPTVYYEDRIQITPIVELDDLPPPPDYQGEEFDPESFFGPEFSFNI